MWKRYATRASLCILVLVMMLCTVLTAVQGVVVSAAEASNGFDDTDVMDDLTSSTVDGKPFDVMEYPFVSKGEPRIINVVEYCYSVNKNLSKDYGIYIYVYNPTGVPLDATSKQNKIQMAVEYGASGEATRYEKFGLSLCSISSGNYKNLFYKYKVLDREIDGTRFLDRVHSHERRYSISGFELVTKGDKNATEYGTGLTCIFTGYAKGYGAGAEDASTLSCQVEDLETLQLKVHHTHYRTDLSDKGNGHYNEVNTVYFAVPDEIFEKYGNLQKIHAEWWEYKTKLALITANQDFYQTFLPYVGVDIGEYNPDVPFDLYYGLETVVGEWYTNFFYDWGYNVKTESEVFNVSTFVYDKCTLIPFAFYAPVEDVQGVFDFLYSDKVAGDVTHTVIEDWIYHYTSPSGGGYIDCNGRQMSQDLFETAVDEGRTMGYNNVNIDLGDTFDLNSYDSNHSWWDKLWDFGFSWPATSEEYKDVSPIVVVTADDLTGSNETIAKRLLVNEDDVAELKAYFAVETAKGNQVVLFRFASTDYFSRAVGRHDNASPNGSVGEKRADTYIAQQTVFFDFDIIDLTFKKDGVYHVIPVVADPIDIVKDFTAPKEELEWWKIVLGLLLVVLLIVVLAPLFPYVVNGIAWVIRMIVMLFKKIATGIGNLFKRRN